MKLRPLKDQDWVAILMIVVGLTFFGAYEMGAKHGSTQNPKVERELEEATITASILSDVVRMAIDNGDDCVEEIYHNYADNLDTMKNMSLDSINLDKYVWGY